MWGVLIRLGTMVLFLVCAATILAFGGWLLGRWYHSDGDSVTSSRSPARPADERAPVPPRRDPPPPRKGP